MIRFVLAGSVKVVLAVVALATAAYFAPMVVGVVMLGLYLVFVFRAEGWLRDLRTRLWARRYGGGVDIRGAADYRLLNDSELYRLRRGLHLGLHQPSPGGDDVRDTPGLRDSGVRYPVRDWNLPIDPVDWGVVDALEEEGA